MSLSIGIVGLPNVGKSTLFNALTKNNVLAANYPFATIEPNVGVVGVPDERLAKLATIFGSEKLLPAALSFVDIAGIVKGASEGAGLGNKFLAMLFTSMAALIHRAISGPLIQSLPSQIFRQSRRRFHVLRKRRAQINQRALSWKR